MVQVTKASKKIKYIKNRKKDHPGFIIKELIIQ